MKAREGFALVAAVALCEAAGVLGALWTTPAVRSAWYLALVKPLAQPPAWLFGPVWVALYAVMGIAAWLVWRGRAVGRVRRFIALWIFALQLGANVLWSALFFSAHAPGLALLDIAILWLLIAATIVAFSRISRAGAWLLAPYLAWVTFAVYLNLMIVLLN